jgi:hypothetical protein
MSHHADELRWLDEHALGSIVAWLERHLVEAQDLKDNAMRQRDVYRADRYSIEWSLLAHLQTEAGSLLKEAQHD